MKYIVQVSELLCHRIEVEANSREEAKAKIENEYYNNNPADDYVDGSVQFEVLS